MFKKPFIVRKSTRTQAAEMEEGRRYHDHDEVDNDGVQHEDHLFTVTAGIGRLSHQKLCVLFCAFLLLLFGCNDFIVAYFFEQGLFKPPTQMHNNTKMK